MLKVLVKQRLSMLLTWFTGSVGVIKKPSKWKAAAFALLMLYAFGALGFLFWHIFDTIAMPFHVFGLDWLYFSFAALMSFGLMFIGSVFSAKAQLYEAHDNDLLLSLPIPPRDILMSRLVMLLVINLALGLLAAVPAAMVAAGCGMFTAFGAAAYAVIFLLLPVLTLAVAALFGWLLSLLTSRVQHRSLVTTVLSFAFFGVYMFFSIRMNTMLMGLAADPSGLAGSLGSVAPLVWIGRAVAEGSIPELIYIVLFILVLFAGMYVVLSATFIKTATTKYGTKTKKTAEAVTVSSVGSALFRRELTHFLNCPAYMINAGLGSAMAVVASVVVLVKRDVFTRLVTEVPGMGELLPLIGIGVLSLMASMMLYTTPSVALEGKSIWIAQSMPVDTREILRAKLRLHCVMSCPAMLISSVCLALVLKPEGLTAVLFFVLPQLLCLLVGVFGLVENLRHPALDWITETQAVKSGIGVLFTMFGAWGLIAVPVLLVILVENISVDVLLTVFTAVTAVLTLLLYRLLMGWGARRFAEL